MPKLPDDQISARLRDLPGWQSRDNAIEKRFQFDNYYQTLAFVNATAWISHQTDHHPLLEVGYNYCLVRYSTHSAGGLTENDFICAAKVDSLLPTRYK